MSDDNNKPGAIDLKSSLGDALNPANNQATPAPEEAPPIAHDQYCQMRSAYHIDQYLTDVRADDPDSAAEALMHLMLVAGSAIAVNTNFLTAQRIMSDVKHAISQAPKGNQHLKPVE